MLVVSIETWPSHAALVPNRLCPIAIKLEFIYPAGTLRKTADGQTLHGRGEANLLVTVSALHPKSGSEGYCSSVFSGSMRLGSLFFVFPTALPTFHAFISSAG